MKGATSIPCSIKAGRVGESHRKTIDVITPQNTVQRRSGSREGPQGDRGELGRGRKGAGGKADNTAWPNLMAS